MSASGGVETYLGHGDGGLCCGPTTTGGGGIVRGIVGVHGPCAITSARNLHRDQGQQHTSRIPPPPPLLCTHSSGFYLVLYACPSRAHPCLPIRFVEHTASLTTDSHRDTQSTFTTTRLPHDFSLATPAPSTQPTRRPCSSPMILWTMSPPA